ncbi:FimV/HubP family polar landmark protein [Thauera linaloolentis]|nr:FimV/HubP family polar landmark protein [Thauera linaloolentis]
MMNTSLKASLIALAIASIPLGSQAAGLGQINVFSGLGQPLRAEIQVSATAQELQSLAASIASPDAFQRANIAYSAAAAAIRVSVDTRASRPVIRLSSDRPINDPFVDLLVELDWANGRVAREYTFLLDPVDVASPQPLAAAVDAPAVRPMPAASVQPRPASPARRAAPESYTVRRGDTLNRIANENTQPGVTLDQMLVALYRANRDAFDGGNINRLRAGEVLTVPDAEAARSIAPAEARREIRAQSADFDAYRRGLAAAAARRAPAPQTAAEQESGGKIVPRVEEARPAADAGDQVKVSRSQPEDGAGSDDADSRLHALEEELAARDRALEEANARLAQLESSISDMQKLLQLRNAPLAQLQQEARGEQPAGEAKTEPAPEPVSEAPAASVAALSAVAAEPSAAATMAEPPAPVAPAAADPSSAQAAEVAQPAAPAAAEAPPAPPKRPVRRPPPPPPEPEPSFLESMMADPTVVAGGAGILALLLGYAGIKLRQRRKQQAVPAPEAVSELAPGGHGVFASAGGESVDTGASSIMQTDFSQTGLSAIDADEGVDPVAEADVYMAYGRDAQAEEILQDALKADPARSAIHLKLLDIYAQRRDARLFETVATELFAQTNGQGGDWEKAAALGRKLDAENPLYAEQRIESEPWTEVPAGVPVGAVAVAAAAASLPGRDAEAAPEADNGPETEPPASLAGLDFTSSLPVEPSQSQMRDTWMVPGDLSQFGGDKNGDDGSALPDAEQALAALEAAAVPDFETDATLDTGIIDFELDLGDEVPVSTEGEKATEAVPEDAGLTFDLEIDELDPAAGAIGLTPLQLGAAQAHGAADEASADLAASLDFELPDLELAPATLLPGEEQGGVSAQDAGAAEAESPVVDIEKTSFDSSLLDFDFDIDTPVPPPAAGAAGLDLTSIDLDLDGFDVPGGEAETVPPSIVATQLGQSHVDLSSSQALEPDFEASSDEVETKLELARAYDDMGDKEGALELLEEVLREGGEAQQAAAREMIARLS